MTGHRKFPHHCRQRFGRGGAVLATPHAIPRAGGLTPESPEDPLSNPQSAGIDDRDLGWRGCELLGFGLDGLGRCLTLLPEQNRADRYCSGRRAHEKQPNPLGNGTVHCTPEMMLKGSESSFLTQTRNLGFTEPKPGTQDLSGMLAQER